MTDQFLRDIILVAIAAFFGGFLARSMKLPAVLGYIVSGILFGALGKQFISSYEGLLELSQLGISLLLFTHGFEISLDALKKIDRKVFILGALQVCITSFVIYPILLLFGLSIPVSLLFSILFSFSSTTIIIKILEEKEALHNFPGSAIFVLLLVQDLFVIPVIILFPILFGQVVGSPTFLVSTFLFALIKPTIVFIVVLLASKFFLSRILNLLFRYPSHELSILATIFTASIAIGLFKYAGLPDVISAFLAGVIISEQGKNLTPLSEIRPLRDLFLVIFFVLTGMLFSLPFFVSHIFVILLLTVLIIGVKFLVIFCLLRAGVYKLKPSLIISSYLINIGEFAAVLAQLALIQHHISYDSYYLLLSVFILSLMCIPFENTFFNIIYSKIKRHKKMVKFFPEHSDRVDTTAMKNHVIVCGHGRVGNEVRNLLELADIPYVVIDFNRDSITGLQMLGKVALSGDPSDSEILDLAHVKTAKALVIAFSNIEEVQKIVAYAKSQNPDILLISRIHDEHDREKLLASGVTSVVFPEFDAGVEIGIEVLDYFKIPKVKKEEYLSRLRKKRKV